MFIDLRETERGRKWRLGERIEPVAVFGGRNDAPTKLPDQGLKTIFPV